MRKIFGRRPLVLWNSGDWFFHHSNAHAHTFLGVCHFLTVGKLTMLTYSTYSTCDRFLFPKLKRNIKGKLSKEGTSFSGLSKVE